MCCNRNITFTTGPRSTVRCANLCIAEDIGVISYFGLARGFLSGKYRSHKDLEGSARGSGVVQISRRARHAHPRRA